MYSIHLVPTLCCEESSQPRTLSRCSTPTWYSHHLCGSSMLVLSSRHLKRRFALHTKMHMLTSHSEAQKKLLISPAMMHRPSSSSGCYATIQPSSYRQTDSGSSRCTPTVFSA